MAARRGELAMEASRLAHGLLTYALLRGMQAQLAQEPPEVKALALPADADFDGDGIVSTDRARRLLQAGAPAARRVFPQLAALRPTRRDPQCTRRRRPRQPLPTGAADQALRPPGRRASFPLVPLDDPPGPP